MVRELLLNGRDLKWLVNAPTHLMDDKTIRVWEHVLKLSARRIGELMAVRHVIEHKLVHIRKARVNQNMKKEL